VVEGVPVKLPEGAVCLGLDGRCTRGVVEKSQFTEGITLFECFEESFFSRDDFEAIKFSLLYYIHNSTSFTFRDDSRVGVKLDFLHRVDDHVQLFFVESTHHKGLAKSIGYLLLFFLRFENHDRHKGCLLIKLAESLSAD